MSRCLSVSNKSIFILLNVSLFSLKFFIHSDNDFEISASLFYILWFVSDWHSECPNNSRCWFFHPTDDFSQESKILGPNHDAIEMISATHLPPFTTEYKFYCCYWLYDLVALSGYISFEFGVFATNIRYPLCLFTELFLSDSAKNKNSQIYLSKKKKKNTKKEKEKKH